MSEPSPPEAVAPLDAYATAKPDEPVWTVQGGDPLGAPLLRLWAFCARVRAGSITGDADWIYPLLEAACKPDNSATNEQEINDLLTRATLTEQVSWNMDAYFKGQSFDPKAPAEKSTAEQIDLFDARVHAADKISGFAGELNNIAEDLKARGFDNVGDANIMLPQLFRYIIQELRRLRGLIEPRRVMKS